MNKLLILAVIVLAGRVAHCQGLLPIQNPEEVVSQFSQKYEAAGKPRIVVYINRDLVHNQVDMQPLITSQRSEQVIGDVVDQPRGNIFGQPQPVNPTVQTGLGGERLSSESVYVAGGQYHELGVQPLNDYDVRQLESVFMDRFSSAGAIFVDQRTAESLNKDFGQRLNSRFITPTNNVSTEQNEVNSLKKSADIAIEILVRDRVEITPTPGGDVSRRVVTVVATAMSINQPGVILGRVSSDHIFGFDTISGRALRAQYRVLQTIDYVDQVSLALMQSMRF